jgi:hypothetical protein
VRVTFPLGYGVRNGAKHSSGKIDKILMLEPAAEDLRIFAVSGRKAEKAFVRRDAESVADEFRSHVLVSLKF